MFLLLLRVFLLQKQAILISSTFECFRKTRRNFENFILKLTTKTTTTFQNNSFFHSKLIFFRIFHICSVRAVKWHNLLTSNCLDNLPLHEKQSKQIQQVYDFTTRKTICLFFFTSKYELTHFYEIYFRKK